MTPEVVAGITASVNFATVIIGIGVIAAAIGLVLVSKRGASMLLGMIGGR